VTTRALPSSLLSKAAAILAGTAITFGLVMLMQALIASGQSAITEVEGGRVVDFVRVQREERLESRRSKPDKPPAPDAPPPEAPQPTAEATTDGGSVAAIAGAAVTPVGNVQVDLNITSGFGIVAGSADGDYLPIVKVAPIYPQRAIDRGIEGYVILEFTVTKSGTVKDVRVVEAEPKNIFDRAAINAALKFKYKPRVVNGEPIEVRGVLNRITFELED